MTLRPRIRSYVDLRLELARARKAAGLSQLELDELAGLQSGYIGKVECGAKWTGDKSLEAILSALGLELMLVRARNGADQARSIEQPDEFILRQKKLRSVNAQRSNAQKQHRMRTDLERSKLARDLNQIRWRRVRELKAMEADRQRRKERQS